MASCETQSFYEAPKKPVCLNNTGLNQEEIGLLTEVATQLFDKSKERFKPALVRCTFFAYTGFDVLAEIVKDHPELTNPRIEGCDSKSFDQHYWLAVDINNREEPRSIIFDPIFGYVGLSDKAPQNPYYDHRRTVTPHAPASEGGIMINTMRI